MNSISSLLYFSILLAGISFSIPEVSAQNPVCAYCGIPMSSATRNSDHKSSCRYYSPPKSTSTTTSAKSSAKSPAVSSPGSSAGASEIIIKSVISNILSAPDPKQREAAEKAKELELERIAAEEAEKKRMQDEIDQAKHDKLMESYKPLPGSKPVGFKGLPGAKKETGNIKIESAEESVVVLKEQRAFEKDTASWIGFQKKMFNERLENSNKWCSNLSTSLTSKVPPLPYKSFDELQPGDVLLIAPSDKTGKVIRWGDQLATGSTESSASHTVTYLKEVNGQKLFLDNLPLHGPTIISEKQFMESYGKNKMDVAQLARYGVAQPLNKDEAEDLFKAAVKMQSENLNSGNTNYGAWGKNDLVCSEASWALINATDRKISGTDFGIKNGIGVDFSPADFYARKQYFLVTPLIITK